MIQIEHTSTSGWETALRGMRNPLQSWEKSDSYFPEGTPIIGQKDLNLMLRLAKGGSEHRKYLRYIHIGMDALAPDYFWKQFSTYKVGVTENSTSTMHKLHSRPLDITDFSCEHLTGDSLKEFEQMLRTINNLRASYIESKDKNTWYAMIQLLPMGYNFRRTLDFNYETALNMILQRHNHKLYEWHGFCNYLMSLPYMTDLYSAIYEEL